MRHAVIKDGVVINVIIAPKGHQIPGHIVVPAGDAGPGDIYDPITDAFYAPSVAAVTRDELLRTAADLRWRLEVGGVNWDGLLVSTDRDSQAKIMAERLAILSGIRVDGDGFKFADGVFRTLSNDEMVAVSTAVREHVRRAFAIEQSVIAAIEGGAIRSLQDVEKAFAKEAGPAR
ncbi:DUF4376 domain-containing protein [Stappia sp. F7233]|uniref:DUF4376 domain-containing protein n=1 Tax=Stappia albiluteola TaxID=2758565 RepID=A0A839ABC3_9HYPH|nr:DUF4376 domain-containing protein [Stappia albiluteola]MBA5776295.1 DUF4376 domain-containing protein [Stappia albiluteola]MBA5776314.1 DUF4376 domain-containing protein [Stappia albiluteola]